LLYGIQSTSGKPEAEKQVATIEGIDSRNFSRRHFNHQKQGERQKEEKISSEESSPDPH